MSSTGTEPSPFAAQLLRASMDGLAGIAASRLFDADPALADRHGPHAFELWRNHFRSQVGALAAAAADGLPEGFARRAAWSRDAFESREVSLEVFGTALRILREVLREDLPPRASQALEPYLQRAQDALAAGGGLGDEDLQPADPDDRLALEILEACLRGDARLAWARIEAALASGARPEDVLQRAVPRLLRETGRLWHRNEISVAEEHFVTQTTRRAMVRLVDRAERAEPNGKTALVMAVAGDLHDVGPQLVAHALELGGWRAVFLGADVPDRELPLAAERFGADLVALSATLDVQREAVTGAIRCLRELPRRIPILIGGSAFELGGEELWRRAGADGYAATPVEAVDIAARLVSAG